MLLLSNVRAKGVPSGSVPRVAKAGHAGIVVACNFLLRGTSLVEA